MKPGTIRLASPFEFLNPKGLFAYGHANHILPTGHCS